MAFKLGDRVRESSTTTGAGAFTLAGAPTGWRTFSSLCAVGDTVWYAISDGTNWETGLGTYSAANTLTRTTILESSNGGAAVNFPAGTKDVFVHLPGSAAALFASLDANGRLSAVSPLSFLATNVSAVSGQRYWMNTAAAGRTVTLPASPVSGDTIEIARIGANVVTIARNGKTIGGLAENLIIDTDLTGVTLTFVNNVWRVRGWEVV